MYGGLYGDLPAPVKSKDSSNDEKGKSTPGMASSPWSVTKMAPPAIRKAALFAAPPSVMKSPALRVKAPGSNPGAVRAATVPAFLANNTQDSAPSISNRNTIVEVRTPVAAPRMPSVTAAPATTVVDEYDPAKPNDYEEYCRERKQKKAEREAQREAERRRREEEEDRERELEREKKREMERVKVEVSEEPRVRLSVSGEEAWKRRGMMSGLKEEDMETRSPSPPKPSSTPGSTPQSLGMSAAERMMAKMGWKAGQGLGRQEQGITTPLMAKKTDRRAGVIVNASPRDKDKQNAANQVTPGGVSKAKPAAVEGTPTRILLLRNMVGPGEVDDELEDEVAGECAKYGTVKRVLIFEITEAGYPGTEAVRIFIEFERAESSVKALVDLDGRFFGGRAVKATFYDEDRFSAHELGPAPGEASVEPQV